MTALISKKNESLEVVHSRSFLVIVPCHNKGQVLAQTLYSLSGLMYPWNLYKLVILADNCTDNTIEIAQKFGLPVLEWKNDDKNQQAGNNSLGWALNQIGQWDKKYDAIVIIKTGSLISSNFLKVMNYYLEKGSDVMQSSNLLLAGPGRWKTELVRIIYLLHNYINPLGRKALGFNMCLSGNGMCFRTNILMKYPFGNNLIAKEWEYSLFLRQKKIPVDFAPEARVWTQFQSISSKSKSGHLLTAGHLFSKRSIHFFKTSLAFVTPPTVILVLGVLSVLVLNVVLWMLGLISVLFVWLWLALAFMEGIYVCTGIVTGRVMLTNLDGK